MHTFPLFVAVLNALLIGLSGLVAAVWMLLDGHWGGLGLGLAAAVLMPPVFSLVFMLRWLFDLGALFAADGGHRALTLASSVLSSLFTHLLVLGWGWLVFDQAAVAPLAGARLLWGYAVMAAPLLFLVAMPFHTPIMVWLFLLVQGLYLVSAVWLVLGAPALLWPLWLGIGVFSGVWVGLRLLRWG